MARTHRRGPLISHGTLAILDGNFPEELKSKVEQAIRGETDPIRCLACQTVSRVTIHAQMLPGNKREGAIYGVCKPCAETLTTTEIQQRVAILQHRIA